MQDDVACLPAAELDHLIRALTGQGFQVVGPVKADEAIVYAEIQAADDLARGWLDDQEKGHYRLRAAERPLYFGHTAAANSWKTFLNPPRRRLWRAQRVGESIRFEPEDASGPPLALLGVRSCDLHAIAIQDAVLLQGEHCDDGYRQRRRAIFTVAVNCTRAAATCFCSSMHTGPEVSLASDLTLTEVCDDTHYFTVAAGSDRGRALLAQLPLQPCSAEQRRCAEAGIANAEAELAAGPRHCDSSDHQALLYRNLESPAWDAVAERCLSCANCTLACPTCFCSAVEDSTDLSGEHAERWQRWDSCFNADFSYLHGGVIRDTTRLRYRQWLTHKLASWIDQFGHSGCVGCGRCISWCPVGIDLTEQVQALRDAEAPCDG